MSDVATRLRSFLLSDASITREVGDRIHQAHVPESSEGDYIYYQRSGIEPLRTLDAYALSPLYATFDVEVISRDIDQCQLIASLIRSKLDCYRGTFDDGTVQAVFVEDHNDDYIPRGTYADEGVHVAAMSVQIY